MPLRPDDNYRGTRALHVRSHRKLGKHRTLTHAALPMVNWLIDNTQVVKVDFGRLVTTQHHIKYTVRAECERNGKRIRVLLVAKDSGQAFTITTRSEEAAVEVVSEIKNHWPLLQAAND